MKAAKKPASASSKPSSAGKRPASAGKGRDGAAVTGGEQVAAAAPDAGAVEVLNARLAAAEAAIAGGERQRSYLQTEKETVLRLWDVTRSKLECATAATRDREADMEGLADRHAMELKIQRQRVKHLQYEHHGAEAALQAEALAATHRLQEAAAQELQAEQDTQQFLRHAARTQEAAHEDAMQALRAEHAAHVSQLRAEYEARARELTADYDRRTEAAHTAAEEARSREVQESCDNRDEHQLAAQQAQAFADVKAYYKDITANNLDLIRQQREELAAARAGEAAAMRDASRLGAENKRLSAPQDVQHKELEELRAQLTKLQHMSEQLQAATTRAAAAEKRAKAAEWDLEVLTQRCSRAEAERDALVRCCEGATPQRRQAPVSARAASGTCASIVAAVDKASSAQKLGGHAMLA